MLTEYMYIPFPLLPSPPGRVKASLYYGLSPLVTLEIDQQMLKRGRDLPLDAGRCPICCSIKVGTQCLAMISYI